MKTVEEKLIQIKRIMKQLAKRGCNSEKINSIYRELINCPGIGGTTFKIIINEDFHHNLNPLGDPDFKPNNI